MSEDDEDVALYDRAQTQESFPIEVADRMLAGESPMRVFRTYRGMTQKQLAGTVGISPLYLSGALATLAAIAKALGVELDDLI